MDLIESSNSQSQSHTSASASSVLVQNPNYPNPALTTTTAQGSPSSAFTLSSDPAANNNRNSSSSSAIIGIGKASAAAGSKIPNRLIGDAYDSDGDVEGDDDDDPISNERLEELTNSWLTPPPPPKKDVVEHNNAKVEDKDKEVNNSNDTSSSKAAAAHLSKIEDMKKLHREKELSSYRHKRDMEEEEREKMQVLVSNFTEEQLDRYEMYRRAAFPKAAIKRIMHLLTGTSVSQNAVIAMSGIAKVFVGEIVEESLDVMERNNETGPVQPKHIREAVRRMRLRGAIPNSKARKFNPYSS